MQHIGAIKQVHLELLNFKDLGYKVSSRTPLGVYLFIVKFVDVASYTSPLCQILVFGTSNL